MGSYPILDLESVGFCEDWLHLDIKFFWLVRKDGQPFQREIRQRDLPMSCGDEDQAPTCSSPPQASVERQATASSMYCVDGRDLVSSGDPAPASCVLHWSPAPHAGDFQPHSPSLYQSRTAPSAAQIPSRQGVSAPANTFWMGYLPSWRSPFYTRRERKVCLLCGLTGEGVLI